MLVHAAYMHWAKSRPVAKYDLAISNILGCSIDDLPGAASALALSGRNDEGYDPLIAAIASRYGVAPAQVTTAQGASGANFLVFAALLAPGDDVLIERPGYDPLVAAPRLLGANAVRFERRFDEAFKVVPQRIQQALTPRTKLIVITSPHNPTGAMVDDATLDEVAAVARAQGAHVLMDEVYLDVSGDALVPAARRGDVFISTSSLTKSYGLSGLRCGWILSAPDVAERIRRTRDVVDGTGSIVAERLSVVAFEHLDRLIERAKAIVARNAPRVRTFVEGRPELEWVAPRGGTVAFPRLRGVTDTSVFAERLLQERGTAVVPGKFFDAPAHIRIGFSGAPEALDPGLTAVAAALDARAW